MNDSTKLERKQRDQLNRIHKLIPGTQRLFELENIVARLQADFDTIDFPNQDSAESYKADMLFLSRLAWDLTEMRHTIYPNKRHNSRYDTGAPHRGPRP